MGNIENLANVTNQTVINIQNMSGSIGIPSNATTAPVLPTRTPVVANSDFPQFSEDFYHLFVFGDEEFYKGKKFVITEKSSDRVPKKHFKLDTRKAYIKPSADDIAMLKSYLCLFANESLDYKKPSAEQVIHLGYISDIKVRDNGINVYFKILLSLAQEAVNHHIDELGMWENNTYNELNHTHWNIIEVNLIEELIEAGLLSDWQLQTAFSKVLQNDDPADADGDNTFGFSVSFAVDNIDIEVTTEEGIQRTFWSENNGYTRCEVNPVSTTTKNRLMRWYASGRTEPFTVIIEDTRITYTKSLLADIEAKLMNDEGLNVEEECRYNNLCKLTSYFEKETAYKQKAITAYLNDDLFHAYSGVGIYKQLLDFIEDILNFPCRQSFYSQREDYVSYDVTYCGNVKKHKGYFVAVLPRKEIESLTEKDGILQFGDFVCEFGLPMVMKVAVQYYVNYVGREIVERDRDALESEDYFKDINASIERWQMAPH